MELIHLTQLNHHQRNPTCAFSHYLHMGILTMWIILLLLCPVSGTVCDVGYGQANSHYISQDTCLAVLAPTTAMTWADADTNCQTTDTSTSGQAYQGLGLASLSTSALQAIGEDVMDYYEASGTLSPTDSTWIGSKEKEREPFWKWTDNTIQRELGCYQNFNTPTLSANHPTNLASSCRSTCSSFQYIAIKNPDLCYCLTAITGFTPLDRSVCDFCTGTPTTQKCGSGNNYEMQRVDGYPWPWVTTATTSAPSNHHGTGLNFCGKVSWQSSTAVLTNDNCQEQKKSICEVPGSCTNPSIFVNDYQLYTGTFTKCFYIEHTIMNWYKAKENCESMSGTLLILNDIAMDSHLTQSLNRWFGPSNAPASIDVWVGLIATEWEWKSGDAFVYTNWYTTTPAYSYNKVDDKCMTAYYNYWRAETCASTAVQGQLCLFQEIHPTTTAGPTTTTVPTTTAEPITTTQPATTPRQTTTVPATTAEPTTTTTPTTAAPTTTNTPASTVTVTDVSTTADTQTTQANTATTGTDSTVTDSTVTATTAAITSAEPNTQSTVTVTTAAVTTNGTSGSVTVTANTVPANTVAVTANTVTANTVTVTTSNSSTPAVTSETTVDTNVTSTIMQTTQGMTLTESTSNTTAMSNNGTTMAYTGSTMSYTNGTVPLSNATVPYTNATVPYTNATVSYTNATVPYTDSTVMYTNSTMPNTSSSTVASVESSSVNPETTATVFGNTSVVTTTMSFSSTNATVQETTSAASTTTATQTTASGSGNSGNNNGNQNAVDPNAGAATGETTELSPVIIALIVLVIVILLILIIVLIVFCVKKKNDNSRTAVAATNVYADARDKAAYPNNDPLYIPASDSASNLTNSTGMSLSPKKRHDFDSMTRIFIE